MAKMIQVPYEFNVSVPISTAQAVQKDDMNPISLEALGLLVNLLSYPSTWELHKTELYKRFAFSKETAVRKAWKDLTTANYIIEFKYRVGKKWEYVYYFRKVPFTSEEKAQILDNACSEHSEIWGLDFPDLKMRTSKSRDNQKNILNTDIYINNNNKNNDDEKRTESSPLHDDKQINLIISNFREETKDELSERSFRSVVKKVIDKHNQGKVKSFRDYLATALIRKIEELELRRIKENASQNKQSRTSEEMAARLNKLQVSDKIPFYNWLEEE